MFLPPIDSETIDELKSKIKAVQNSNAKKQDKLKAGSGINIDGDVISANFGGYEGVIEQKRSIKILHVGNSYIRDATSNIVPLLRELLPNVDVTIGIIHNDGCSLQKYHEEIFPQGTTQTFDFCKGLAWQFRKSNYNIETAFNLEDWDIVTFQQRSHISHDYSTYQPYLRQNIKTVFSKLKKNVKVGWFIGNPRVNNDYGVANFTGQAVAAQRVLQESACEFVIPCGTAIQNLRTIPSFLSIGNEGGMQSSSHMQTGIGALVEGYVYILWIAQMLGLPVGVYGSKYRPVEGDARVTHGTTTPEGITDENCRLAQIAASYAMKNPFEITDMSNEIEE